MVDLSCVPVGAEINLLKEKVFIKCDNERLEFNFSKFADKHVVKEPISEDIIETLASIAVASIDVVEHHMLNQDEPFNDEEKRSSGTNIMATTTTVTDAYPT